MADYYFFSDDVTTESVQYYTVKSKFTVSTLTCLDHLAVREDCECDVKQCVIKVNLLTLSLALNILPYSKADNIWLIMGSLYLVKLIQNNLIAPAFGFPVGFF